MRREPLRGERVVLRPLGREHLARCVTWFNDREVTYFLGREEPLTMEEEVRWFNDYRAKVDEEIYAIEVNGDHVGNVGLHNIDRRNRKASIGIVIGEKASWSKGYGTDAMRTVLRYAFRDLRLHKVNLDVIDYNERAIRVYEKCGFVREGVRRDELWKRGRFVNLVRMSILEDEFPRAPARDESADPEEVPRGGREHVGPALRD
jgi:RimJ/RimL family protein N-acetyltransferase